MPNIEYMTVTGLWSHVIDDGIVDGDPNPDIVKPTGKVIFAPKLPAGFVIGGTPTENVTIAELPALIAAGILTDLQGNDGVQLPARIDGTPIRWVAKPDVRYNKQSLATKSVTFDPPTTGTTLHLNDLFDDIGELSPLITNQIRAYRDEVVALRGEVAEIVSSGAVEAVADALSEAGVLTSEDGDTRYAPVAQAVPSGGSAGQVLTRTASGAVWAAAPSGGGSPGVSVVDNGDGTFSLSGSSVADNGDGTFSISV